MNLTILGGGIAGAVAAKYAKEKGFNNIELIEKDVKLGGLHKDIEIDNLHFDIGAFFFDASHTVLQVFDLKKYMWQIPEFNCLSLTNKGNLDLYPVTMKGYIKEWGFHNFCLDASKLIITRIQKTLNSQNWNCVDDELEYYFGPFYRKTGLRSYVERLYGMSPSDISLQFSGKRLGYVTNAVKFNQIIKKIATFKFSELNKWRIAPSIYARPISGFSAMYNYIADELKDSDIDLNFGEQIQKILLDEKKIIAKDNREYQYDYLLSSIPLGLLCKLCDVPLNQKLEYKPLYTLFFVADEAPIDNCHVLFNFSEKGFWKRVTFHSSYYQNNGRHYFNVESIPNETHLQDTNIVNILEQDFRDTFKNISWGEKFQNIKLVGHNLTPNAYPVYRRDFNVEAIAQVKQYFASKDIYLVGRQGEFDYISSGDAALSSIKAIDQILTIQRA
ncbi:MAG: NAD(P)-binding protein [Richelia sp. RM2_1_2]|nr:NAD(P)-binding protein [Richelia sp. RM1_1_1]NJO64358.1 NAD(P)-binding protein [Richelia sp. RM2_1_2]